ncbi:MAG: hypothetical protein ACQESP_00395 [Candidatus Muiribacteriota bacterium]
MINISIPCSIMIGPGFDTFALALDHYVNIKILEINTKEEGIKIYYTKKLSTHFISELQFNADRVYKFIKKNKMLSSKCIEIEFKCELEGLRFLNLMEVFMVGIIKVVDLAYNLNMDEEKMLKFFKRITDSIECAVSSLMGDLGLVDRDKKNFLTLKWPEKWGVSIIRKKSDCYPVEIHKKFSKDFVSDSVSKSGIFVSSVYTGSSELLSTCFQDKLNYTSCSGIIPFADKINLIGKVTRVSGVGFLKNDCGVIIVGETKKLKNCVERICKLYLKNQINFDTYNFRADSIGLNIWEE